MSVLFFAFRLRFSRSLRGLGGFRIRYAAADETAGGDLIQQAGNIEVRGGLDGFEGLHQ